MVELPKETHTFGRRFSRDVHGILIKPREAVKVILKEADLPYSLSVPLFVVIAAAVMSVIGKFVVFDITNTVFGGPAWLQVLRSVFQGLALTVELIVAPIALIVFWVFWSIVFHFLGSIISSSDITQSGVFYKTTKLAGFMFAPLFLNVLPILPVSGLYVMPLVTGYWSAWIAYLAMRENYKTTRNGALIIVFPYLFTVLYSTLAFLVRLAS